MKDPYIQENGTLKNKLGITEYKELNNAEKDIGFVKLIDIDTAFKKRFTADDLKAAHKHILKIYLNGQENLELYQYIKQKL